MKVGALAWAIIGAVVALTGLDVRQSGFATVAIASIAFPAAAAGAAVALGQGRPRLAGLLLLLSVATPTYFAYVLNVPALVASLWLLTARGVTAADTPQALRSVA